MEGAYYLNTTQLHDNVGDFFFLYTYMNLSMVYITAKHHLMVKPFLNSFKLFCIVPMHLIDLWIFILFRAGGGAFKFSAQLYFHVPFNCESLLFGLNMVLNPSIILNIDFTLCRRNKISDQVLFSRLLWVTVSDASFFCSRLLLKVDSWTYLTQWHLGTWATSATASFTNLCGRNRRKLLQKIKIRQFTLTRDQLKKSNHSFLR